MDWAELQNWTEYSKLLIGLIAIVSPLAVTSIYLSLVGDRTEAERRRIVAVGNLTYVTILIIFTWAGDSLLYIFGITIPSFQVAGGILFMFIAFELMRPSNSESGSVLKGGESTSLGIVPLGIPLLAGPGAISVIVIYSSLHDSSIEHRLVVSGVILTSAIIFTIILLSASLIARTLGNTGLTVINRIMGLIIAAIAVEFIVGGLGELFPGWMGTESPSEHN